MDIPVCSVVWTYAGMDANDMQNRILTHDLGQNIIRPTLAVVHGAQVPYPYGGTPRVIMADLDQQALQARGLTPADVSNATCW
jgi:multidrug efflux pump subunit AcrB